MVEKINIPTLLELMQEFPVLDVRSPGEFQHAHIPRAHSLPLFDNEERRVVGTAYKQESREKAIKIGVEYFGLKMRKMIEQVEAMLKDRSQKTIIVHCWRGGMRSAGVAWLLDLYGFKVYTVVGGYRAFRRWAITQHVQDHPLRVLGGYTGSGKTEVLHYLHQSGESIIDLEHLAHHKGSAFGALGQPPQPSQEMFENLFAFELWKQALKGKQIWIEDESQRIGHVNITKEMWTTIRNKPVFFIDVPFEERLNYIINQYGKLNRGDLAAAIIRIQKRLGGLETKTALNFLAEDNIKECFRVLLHYYDKQYSKSLANRPEPSPPVISITCQKSGCNQTAQEVLQHVKTQTHA
jgi:tRNA 2-selenouridine synthase